METEAEVAASPRVHLKLTNEEALAIIKRMVRLSNLFLNGEKSKEHEWFEELSEALKKSYPHRTTPSWQGPPNFATTHHHMVNNNIAKQAELESLQIEPVTTADTVLSNLLNFTPVMDSGMYMCTYVGFLVIT